MIAFRGMLLEPAKQSGMKVPEDADNFDYDEYPHFSVFCAVQIGAAMPYPTAHWENAKVIAEIPEEKVRTITWEEILPQVATGYPIP